MPSHSWHRRITRLFLGHGYPEVHRALDWPARFLGRGHRVLFHGLGIAALIGALAALFRGRSPVGGALAGVGHVATDRAVTAGRRTTRRLLRATGLQGPARLLSASAGGIGDGLRHLSHVERRIARAAQGQATGGPRPARAEAQGATAGPRAPVPNESAPAGRETPPGQPPAPQTLEEALDSARQGCREMLWGLALPWLCLLVVSGLFGPVMLVITYARRTDLVEVVSMVSVGCWVALYVAVLHWDWVRKRERERRAILAEVLEEQARANDERDSALGETDDPGAGG